MEKDNGVPTQTGAEFVAGKCPDGQPHKMVATPAERTVKHSCCQVLHQCSNCGFTNWFNKE